jgi:hypothetical protein
LKKYVELNNVLRHEVGAKLHNIISTHMISKRSNNLESQREILDRSIAEDGPSDAFGPVDQANLRNRHSDRPGAVKPVGSKRSGFLGPGLQSERLQVSSDRKIFNLKKNIMEENIIANNPLSKKKTIKEIKAIQKFTGSITNFNEPGSRPKKSQFGASVRNPTINQIKPMTPNPNRNESGFRSLFDFDQTHSLQEEIEKKNDLKKFSALPLGMESHMKNSLVVGKELEEIDQ